MIRVLTVTLNPSIDKTVYIRGFRLGGTNYIENTRTDIGGKGINVSKTLNNFGIDNVATGFLTESSLPDLDRIGIRSRFFLVEGNLRVNTKINDLDTNVVTELNERGFHVNNEDLSSFIYLFKELCPSEGIVVLSGSLPLGVPDDIYARLIRIANGKGTKTVLDAHGNALSHGLNEKPYAVKPNLHELSSLVCRKLDNLDHIADSVEEIKDRAEMIAVSLGKDGAMFYKNGRFLYARTFTIQSKSSVGAGDAMTAAIACSCVKNFDIETTARFATCAGTMTCLKEGSSVCSLEDVLLNYDKVKLKWL